ncbi:Nuclear transcription factor Y subunit B-2 [Senna tora]|uniref:Nuclear transcription factor Y subunit B-2 n=1 Tax=Senna tora TaxID=362788 RepID=A0A834SSG4_9FABA|nr:Nuclear transcription factor Y subunit B-2 [Senna tora]
MATFNITEVAVKGVFLTPFFSLISEEENKCRDTNLESLFGILGDSGVLCKNLPHNSSEVSERNLMDWLSHSYVRSSLLLVDAGVGWINILVQNIYAACPWQM